MFSWAYHDSWLDRQVNDNTQGVCLRNTSGMIHHNNLSATAFKNTSTIHQQSKHSSLLSSTAWVYFGALYRLKNWIWICITRTALWVSLWLIQNVISRILPLGIHNPTAVPGIPCVSVRAKHCTVAYRRHVTSTLPPDVLHRLSNAKQGLGHVWNLLPAPSIQLFGHCLGMKRRWSITPADEITTASACILYWMQVKQKLNKLSSVQYKQKVTGSQWTQSINKSKTSTIQVEWTEMLAKSYRLWTVISREHTITTIDLGSCQTMWTRMQSISALKTREQWIG